MFAFRPEDAGDAPLTDDHVARTVAQARRANLIKIPVALGFAAGFVTLALMSTGPLVAVWHIFFSLSLLATAVALFSTWLHFKAARKLVDDLPDARALNLAPARFWQAHWTLFPLNLP